MSKTSFVSKSKKIGKQLWKTLRHVLFHNGWVKLLALVISLVLWTGLISQDESLTRDKTWQNVNVSVTGSDTMKRNNYIVVSNLEELLSNVSVTAAVPQKQYEIAEISAYNLRVDLSRISGTGSQELKILSSASGTYGKVTNTVPSSVTVEVEEYATRPRIPISFKVGGEYQNGWYKGWYMPAPSVDPTLIAVSGPKELVTTIQLARVVIDPETLKWEEGTLLTTGEIKLYNRAGEEVTSPLIEMTVDGVAIDTVLVEGNVLPAKSFQTSDLIKIQNPDELENGDRISSIKISPETIQVAARSEVLEQIDDLTPDQDIILLEDLEETTKFQIKIQKPSDEAILSSDTVTVTVEIEREGE